MKRKYREAMRAAARQQIAEPDDDEEDAIEARDWHDEWVMTATTQQDEPTEFQQ